MFAILGRSMNIVEERRYFMPKPGSQIVRAGNLWKLNLCGRSVEADTVNMKTPSRGLSVPTSNAAERPR
jgi:hypothetical protein